MDIDNQSVSVSRSQFYNLINSINLTTLTHISAHYNTCYMYETPSIDNEFIQWNLWVKGPVI